jgi:DhnA family fructose-bisphosphate aldolase class Ia
MWDGQTAYDARGMREMNLDGAKLMFRLEPKDRGSGQTIVWCAQAINACLEEGLTVFLEPLPVREQGGKFVVQKEAGELARLCGVASALGRSSLNTWLKLPCCPDYELVARATTCPILMLGGEAAGQPLGLLEELARGLRAGPNVRGALIGRNVLYPGPHDPAVMARATWLLVHEHMPARLAWEQANSIGA